MTLFKFWNGVYLICFFAVEKRKEYFIGYILTTYMAYNLIYLFKTLLHQPWPIHFMENFIKENSTLHFSYGSISKHATVATMNIMYIVFYIL